MGTSGNYKFLIRVNDDWVIKEAVNGRDLIQSYAENYIEDLDQLKFFGRLVYHLDSIKDVVRLYNMFVGPFGSIDAIYILGECIYTSDDLED